MKRRYPLILAGALAVVGNTTFFAGMDSGHAESSPWSRDLGFTFS